MKSGEAKKRLRRNKGRHSTKKNPFLRGKPGFLLKAKKGKRNKTRKPSKKKHNKKHKKKKNKKEKNKKDKKKTKNKKKTQKYQKKELFSYQSFFSFLMGVQNSPFLATWLKKRAPKKPNKNGGFSNPFFEKQFCVTKRPFLDKNPIQKFLLSLFLRFSSLSTANNTKMSRNLIFTVF